MGAGIVHQLVSRLCHVPLPVFDRVQVNGQRFAKVALDRVHLLAVLLNDLPKERFFLCREGGALSAMACSLRFSEAGYP